MTLDLEMPGMGGLEVLDALREAKDSTSVIVVSALTRQGSQMTLRALEKGVFDFITKPDLPSVEQNLEAIRRELAPRVRAVANRLEVRSILRQHPAPVPPNGHAKPTPPPRAQPLPGVAGHLSPLAIPGKPELVLIGVSTGGPNALARLLPAIPSDIGVPLLIVQHMPPIFTQSLAESLATRCGIRVREALHGDKLEPNTAFIAPGGRQMRLAHGPETPLTLQITDDPPENNCRPAVDYLFRSVANHLPGRAMAVILTGMGSDGTLGLKLLKRHGCFVIAQDEASCVVYGMPRAAVEAGVADLVLPLEAIGGRIAAAVRGGRP
jgi:two-component system chemotaxis response regulator CheB